MEKFLRSKGVVVAPEWAAAQVAPKKLTATTQRDWEALFQQVIKGDLKDIVAESLLPEGADTLHLEKIAGPVMFQIVDALDVTVSRFDQLSDIERAELEAKKAAAQGKPAPVVQKPLKPTRVLLLTLHDGKTQMPAMELPLVKQIPSDPPVGSKVRLRLLSCLLLVLFK